VPVQTVRAYFGKDQPLTAQGKLALARALLLEGHRADAQNLVREMSPLSTTSGITWQRVRFLIGTDTGSIDLQDDAQRAHDRERH
jgi:hypothetical protein